MNYYIINNRIIEYEAELNAQFYNYPKLTESQKVFYEANPSASLQEVIEERMKVSAMPTISELQQQLIDVIKNTAKELLSSTDYKVLRHNDQVYLNIATTLSNEEYTALLQSRQAIRDWSNVKELEIQTQTTIDELELVEIDYVP